MKHIYILFIFALLFSCTKEDLEVLTTIDKISISQQNTYFTDRGKGYDIAITNGNDVGIDTVFISMSYPDVYFETFILDVPANSTTLSTMYHSGYQGAVYIDIIDVVFK